MAKAYEINRDYKNARIWYNKSLAKGYKTDMILTNIALLDIMESRWSEARERLKQALEVNPNVSVAWSNLGTVAFMQGDYEQAKKYFMKASAIDRFAMLPRLNLAKTLLKMGDAPSAIRAYDDILAIVPNDELILVNAIRACWADHNGEKVISLGKRLFSVSRNPETLTNVGIMMEYFSRRDLAAVAYQKAAAADSRYVKARQLLERLGY